MLTFCAMCPNYLARGYQGLNIKQAKKEEKKKDYKCFELAIVHFRGNLVLLMASRLEDIFLELVLLKLNYYLLLVSL